MTATMVLLMTGPASPASAAPACPSTSALTPGAHNTPGAAALYCGGTYTDTWDAEGEKDWIAFYTTQASATVIVHYLATASGGGHSIGVYLFNAGASAENPQEVGSGPTSQGDQDPRGVAYTFESPGVHYVEVEVGCCESEGTSYQLSLAGEWSQTPPTGPAPARTPPTTCPPSSTLTPGAQGSASSAVLYCGGTYTDTWNAEGEKDWIAFYTTQASATVIVHYLATASGGGHSIGVYLFNAGASAENPQEVGSGPTSQGDQDPRGVSYTFESPGVHYVEVEVGCCESEGTSYQLSLAGEWSQTPPPPPPPIEKKASPPPPCIVPRVKRGVTQANARHNIEGAHCSVGSVRSKPSAKVAKGRVIELTPAAGTHLSNGAKVTIVVSSGRPRNPHLRLTPLGVKHGKLRVLVLVEPQAHGDLYVCVKRSHGHCLPQAEEQKPAGKTLYIVTLPHHRGGHYAVYARFNGAPGWRRAQAGKRLAVHA
jgi:PASTA domain